MLLLPAAVPWCWCADCFCLLICPRVACLGSFSIPNTKLSSRVLVLVLEFMSGKDPSTAGKQVAQCFTAVKYKVKVRQATIYPKRRHGWQRFEADDGCGCACRCSSRLPVPSCAPASAAALSAPPTLPARLAGASTSYGCAADGLARLARYREGIFFALPPHECDDILAVMASAAAGRIGCSDVNSGRPLVGL